MRTAKSEMEYRIYKNKLKSTLKQAEKNHYRSKFDLYQCDLRKTWALIKQLISKKRRC
jgi:hypothetical protein